MNMYYFIIIQGYIHNIIQLPILYTECVYRQKKHTRYYCVCWWGWDEPCTLTLAMNTPASMTALMCFSQPELSRPSRKSDMEGDRSSHTASTTQLRHRQEANSLRGDSTQFNFTAQTFITMFTRKLGLGWENPGQKRLDGATPGDSPSVPWQLATNGATNRLN